jgi:signal transduction histidine kinase
VLGLSIAGSIVTAHGGRWQVWAEERGGLVVEVALPGVTHETRLDPAGIAPGT